MIFWKWRLVSGVVALLLCGALVAPCRAAHPDDPLIKAAIEKGVSFLRGRAGSQQGGYDALCAYAMLKAKVKPSDPAVAKALERITGKVRESGEYYPPEYHVYEAGVDLMALEAADPGKYKSHMSAIVSTCSKSSCPMAVGTIRPRTIRATRRSPSMLCWGCGLPGGRGWRCQSMPGTGLPTGTSRAS